jgi:hypothetical protein
VLALAGVFVIQGIWVGAYYHGSHQPPFEPFAAGVVACFALGVHADRRGLRAGLVVFAVRVVASAILLAVGGSAVGDALSVLIWWAAAIGIGGDCVSARRWLSCCVSAPPASSAIASATWPTRRSRSAPGSPGSCTT